MGSWVRSRRTSFGVLWIMGLLLGYVGAPAVSAHAPGTTAVIGDFEIDGNLADDPGSGAIDWSTPPPNVTDFTDGSGRGDDSFKQGSKELEPSGWTCLTGSVPGKDDIVGGQVAFREVDGDQFTYVNYTRAGVNGDAHIDYEFNQSSEPNPACPDLPARTQDDIVITFDTENGGQQIFVRAFRWVGDATAGTFDELDVGFHGVTFDGAVNIPNTIPGHKAGDFGEAALNLTDTIGEIVCGQFATAYMKTRASTSINAAIKDRTRPEPVDVGLCPDSQLAKAVRNVTDGGPFQTEVAADPGEVLEYRLTYTNAGEGDATDVVITDTIQPRQTFLSCTGGCTTNGPPVTELTWELGTVEAGDSREVTFQVRLDATFPVGTTEVKNVAVVDTAEEEEQESNETTVTVTAQPDSEPHKAVRNVTTGGAFGASTNASPGDVIEYELTYHNHGNADATGVTLTDTIEPRQTFLSCTGGCTTNGPPVTEVSWDLGTVEAGGTRVVSFQVELDATFPSGQTIITNVAVADSDQEEPEESNETTVTVTAEPDLALVKEASQPAADVGDEVTYTLTFSNDGNGDATGVVITEPLPAGTEFVSCTGDCTQSGDTVSWNIGTVPAGTGGSVTLTVRIVAIADPVSCELCNVATIASPDQPGGPRSSNQVCVDVNPQPDPTNANADGSAAGAHVQVGALELDVRLPDGDENHPPEFVQSEADGATAVPSSDGEADSVLTVDLPADGSVLHADVLRATSNSAVLGNEANATSTGQAVGVDLLGGTVTADLVLAVASATATGSSATATSAGSVIEGVTVLGVPQSVAPNTTVGLPELLFGPGATVVLYEVSIETAQPEANFGGTYGADITVNMIHVLAPQHPLLGNVDIVVGQAVAHADFPQTTVCGDRADQSVSGHAFILSAMTDPSLLPVVEGFVSIPSTGGDEGQHLNTADVEGNVVTNADTGAAGTLGATSSDAASFAEGSQVCLVPGDEGCLVSATAVRSDASSTADDAGAASSTGTTTLASLVVAGVDVCAELGLDPLCTPDPNTVIIPVDGVAVLILNEQCPPNSATCESVGTAETEITVRAIHLILLDRVVDIIVAESHSDATFN